MLAHRYVGFEPIGKITCKNFDEALYLRLLRRDARHKLTRGPLLQTKFHHTDIQNKLKVFQRVKEHTLLSPSYDKTTPLIRQKLEGHTRTHILRDTETLHLQKASPQFYLLLTSMSETDTVCWLAICGGVIAVSTAEIISKCPTLIWGL